MSKGEEQDKLSRRKYLQVVGGTVAGLVVGGALGYVGKPTVTAPAETVTSTVTETVTGTVTAPPPTTQPPAKKFEGVTITLMQLTGPYFSMAGKPEIYHEWEQETGGKVIVDQLAFPDLHPKLVAALISGTATWDLVNWGPPFYGDVAGTGGLEVLDKYITDPNRRPADWDDVLPGIQAYNSWNGHYYSFPGDGDTATMYYRKDLLANADHQANFKKKFGYDMPSPDTGPRTWSQFNDVAEFFNGWDWGEGGRSKFGTLRGIGKVYNTWQYGFLPYLFPYVKMPGPVDKYHGVAYFDPETMECLMNQPGHVKAAEMFVESFKKGSSEFDLGISALDAWNMYVRGDIALAIAPGNIGPMEFSSVSTVNGKVGHNLLPGAEQVYDQQSKSWLTVSTKDPLPEPGATKDINFVPYCTWGGWVNSIPVTSKVKDAAYDYAAWIGGKKASLELCLTMEPEQSGVNPFRYSHLQWEPWKAAGFTDPNYVLAQGLSYAHENNMRDMRIPGTLEYYDAIDVNMGKALTGSIEPKQAMENIYNTWTDITKRKDVKKQLQFYRQDLGLPV
jgi:multiple sugar transport system substrate-binding protein